MSKSIRTKYKRCPFCGGWARLRGVSDKDHAYFMQCQICGMTTRETLTAAEAQKLWEERVKEEQDGLSG